MQASNDRVRFKVAADSPDPAYPGVHPTYLVCLEDLKRVTLLRAYLRNRYGLTPEQYQAKWNLPQDYPMAPPEYLAAKRDQALIGGLGTRHRPKGKKSVEVVVTHVPSLKSVKPAVKPKAQ